MIVFEFLKLRVYEKTLYIYIYFLLKKYDECRILTSDVYFKTQCVQCAYKTIQISKVLCKLKENKVIEILIRIFFY